MNRVGPSHMHMQLLMVTSGPIIWFWEVLLMQHNEPIVDAYVAANGYIWADNFLRDVTDAIGWAHHICTCGC